MKRLKEGLGATKILLMISSLQKTAQKKIKKIKLH